VVYNAYRDSAWPAFAIFIMFAVVFFVFMILLWVPGPAVADYKAFRKLSK